MKILNRLYIDEHHITTVTTYLPCFLFFNSRFIKIYCILVGGFTASLISLISLSPASFSLVTLKWYRFDEFKFFNVIVLTLTSSTVTHFCHVLAGKILFASSTDSRSRFVIMIPLRLSPTLGLRYQYTWYFLTSDPCSSSGDDHVWLCSRRSDSEWYTLQKSLFSFSLKIKNSKQVPCPFERVEYLRVHTNKHAVS